MWHSSNMCFVVADMQVGHGEFVTEWPASFSQSTAAADADGSSSSTGTVRGSSSSSQQQQHAVWLHALPAYCRDLASVVMRRTPVNFVQKSKLAADKINSRSSNGHANGGLQPAHHFGDVASRVDAPTQWN